MFPEWSLQRPLQNIEISQRNRMEFYSLLFLGVLLLAMHHACPYIVDFTILFDTGTA